MTFYNVGGMVCIVWSGAKLIGYSFGFMGAVIENIF
jgi:hypothetical protein